MTAILAALISMTGSFFSGLFGFKGEQAKTVQNALEVLKSVNDLDGQALTASASSIQAILTQGSWLERQWRPCLMIMLIVLIASWFFGYVPPHFNDAVSPMMREVLDLLKVGVLGYVPCRTLEKIIQQLSIANILRDFIKKKIA